MISAVQFIRNSILKYQYGQMEGWSYAVEDGVWFYDGITANEPDFMDLVNDVKFNYNTLP